VIGRRIDIRGTVQGVGFRPWVYRLAHELGVHGRVKNDARGVTIDAFGEEVDRFIDRLLHEGPPASHIDELTTREIPIENVESFVIVGSDRRGDKRVAIPPDLATCDRCLAEIFDPRNRRYRYPFTNCTECGPRFTISRSVPYDRPMTTMAPFTMCPECAREYHDVHDRRFHAQPNACPACGPRLTLVGVDGFPLLESAARLRGGAILAIKGLGGYHLACDATSPSAVARLRARKRREAKPFAVMVRDLAAARALAFVDDVAAALLRGVERPVVLVPRRPHTPIAEEVSPDTPLIGIMLPYTPLHHLLLCEVGRPLVMTSGNVSDEPIAYRDDDARERLGSIADFFLVHDREIAARCEDSVARVVDGRPMVLRRSRGWVPAPFAVSRGFAQPILAVGGDLKNVVGLACGDAVWLGPHVGDLEHADALEALEDSVARLRNLTGKRPEVIAHDLHPDYHSARWAQAQPGLKVAVQHHHAHVAAVMGEHRLEGPVLGLAWDGTGYGTDGTAWGGELLRCDLLRSERLATFRPLPLAGGDRAIVEPWRLALAMLDDAFPGGAPLAAFSLFSRIPPNAVALVRRLIADGLAPLAHGVGRWFDAVGSLILGLERSRFEGEVAMRWNLAADGGRHRAYPFEIVRGQIDLRRAVRALVDDHLEGRSAGEISARFHQTLIAAAVELLWPHPWELPVVLSGGCFQNPLLAEGIAKELRELKRRVYLPSRVPPGDGGLALGQALIANALVEEGL
jgi:hydrogenase maturation protein HypF